ncbi:MAG: hypothetical protein N3E52_02630 [Candidatus Bathyarchaeota archaeon]|nr:hypothetical protein [Candidatus Bathyarchaeota archaeon]
MAEIDESNSGGRDFAPSKFSQILLIIATVALIFLGPTYIPYVLANVLNIDYFASVVSGFALFIAGLLLLFFFSKKKVITL